MAAALRASQALSPYDGHPVVDRHRAQCVGCPEKGPRTTHAQHSHDTRTGPYQAAEERSLNAECKMQTVKCRLFLRLAFDTLHSGWRFSARCKLFSSVVSDPELRRLPLCSYFRIGGDVERLLLAVGLAVFTCACDGNGPPAPFSDRPGHAGEAHSVLLCKICPGNAHAKYTLRRRRPFRQRSEED